MKPARGAIPVAVVVGCMAGSAIAQNTEWKAMEYRDLREKSASDILQTTIWSAEIKAQNDSLEKETGRSLRGRNAWIGALIQSFDLDGRRLVISMLTSRKCDNGANHFASGREPSVCPLKIALVAGGNVRVVAEATGCLLEPPERDAPTVHQHDNVQVQFDAKQRLVRMRALIGGKWTPQCLREFRVTQ